MEFDIGKLAEQIKTKLTSVLDELDFLAHVAEYAKVGDLNQGHDITYVKLDALAAMTEAIANVRSSATIGLEKIECTVAVHSSLEKLCEKNIQTAQEPNQHEAEDAAQKRYLRYARLFVIRTAIEDWLEDDKGVFLVAGNSIAPSRSVEDIIEQVDFRLPKKDGDGPLFLESWRRGFGGSFSFDDRVELRRQNGPDGEEIVNPIVVPAWHHDMERWEKRFCRGLEIASNFDKNIHPKGFDSFRLDHWRPGEDW